MNRGYCLCPAGMIGDFFANAGDRNRSFCYTMLKNGTYFAPGRMVKIGGNMGEQMRRIFVIDGERFGTLDEFYTEMPRVFTDGLDWEPGHNLDAFNDLLRGGFGMHEYREPIHIIWRNMRQSRQALGEQTVNQILAVIGDNEDSGHNCTLEVNE